MKNEFRAKIFNRVTSIKYVRVCIEVGMAVSPKANTALELSKGGCVNADARYEVK